MSTLVIHSPDVGLCVKFMIPRAWRDDEVYKAKEVTAVPVDNCLYDTNILFPDNDPKKWRVSLQKRDNMVDICLESDYLNSSEMESSQDGAFNPRPPTDFVLYVVLILKTHGLHTNDQKGWFMKGKRHISEFVYEKIKIGDNEHYVRKHKPFRYASKDFITLADMYDTQKGYLDSAVGAFEFEFQITIEEVNGNICCHVLSSLRNDIKRLRQDFNVLRDTAFKTEEKYEKDMNEYKQNACKKESEQIALVESLHHKFNETSKKFVEYEQKLIGQDMQMNETQSETVFTLDKVLNKHNKRIAQLEMRINSLATERNAMSQRMILFWAKSIGCLGLFIFLVICLISLDYSDVWTYAKLGLITFLIAFIFILYCFAKDSLADIEKWWKIAKKSCQSYFKKKDNYFDSILATTADNAREFQNVLYHIPAIINQHGETTQNLGETFQEVGQYFAILNEYTQKLGNQTNDCIGDFKQEMIRSSQNLNCLVRGVAQTGDDLSWELVDFLKRFENSTEDFMLALEQNTNNSKALVLQEVNTVSKSLQNALQDLGDAAKQGQFRPFLKDTSVHLDAQMGLFNMSNNCSGLQYKPQSNYE
ncbi:hypothetical protein Ddc_09993 [Ditylenchus destructor]|nr:hypothetical protein Ddc_09993 [Ditylenchus destructor]